MAGVPAHSRGLIAGRGRALFPLCVAAGMLCVFGYRVVLMGRSAADSILLPCFHHDAAIFGVLALACSASVALGACAASHGRALSLAAASARFCVLIGAVVYIADIVAFKYFHTRLYVQDVLEFGGEWSSLGSLLGTGWQVVLNKPLWKIATLATGVAATSFVAWGFLWRPLRPRPAWPLALMLAFVGTGLLGLHSLPAPPQFYHFGDKRLYENVFERNLTVSRARPYSAAFRGALLDRYRPERVCEPGRGARPNVLLVIVEGLSSYQSQFFSGLHDYTPELDRIASANRSYTRFHANGWTTRGGLIALLSGHVPLIRPDAEANSWGSVSFSNFHDADSIPRRLAPHGYSTHFLTTGDLSFTNKRDWLEAIGFDHVEGHETPFYDGFPRGSFKASPDEALFQRAVQLMQTGALAEPYFAALETVSSHQPFHAPDGSPDSEESVLRYVDGQIGWLYRKLEDLDFFSNGMLLILGDHRAMMPYSRREIARLGRGTSALVPLVVVWRELPAPVVISSPHQQTDLLSSLAGVVSDEACRSAHAGRFLSDEPAAAGIVLHAVGDDRDLVLVVADGEIGLVRADGDDTRIVDGRFPDPRAILDRVNYERIAGGGAAGSPPVARAERADRGGRQQ